MKTVPIMFASGALVQTALKTEPPNLTHLMAVMIDLCSVWYACVCDHG